MKPTYTIPKVNNPCTRECPDRTTTCHGTCEKYLLYDEYNKKMRELKNEIARSTKY